MAAKVPPGAKTPSGNIERLKFYEDRPKSSFEHLQKVPEKSDKSFGGPPADKLLHAKVSKQKGPPAVVKLADLSAGTGENYREFHALRVDENIPAKRRDEVINNHKTNLGYQAFQITRGGPIYLMTAKDLEGFKAAGGEVKPWPPEKKATVAGIMREMDKAIEEAPKASTFRGHPAGEPLLGKPDKQKGLENK